MVRGGECMGTGAWEIGVWFWRNLYTEVVVGRGGGGGGRL